ncbi:hypothetical protein QBC46DRAFT_399861 [Diplogelasinospora grovesii]|uniref:Uncharacterized protein n=1 Tax=Diplogelasinospora grovesii TaxID=303347 RepID=A0AAN6MYW3_9PEZI|nr:hypothetical protein QBC46DRAFT_399861 [Diplogelasinospora grovesii]
MGSKRGHAALSYSDTEESPPQPANKRPRAQPSSLKPKAQEAKTDATYGQRSFFPGLEEPVVHSDEEVDYEDEGDALAYLKSVRQEASGIPHLLVAPRAGPQLPPHLAGTDGDEEVDRSIYNTGIGDSRGYYHDGTYLAAPDPEPSPELEEGELYDDHEDLAAAKNQAKAAAELREAYFESLISRFTALREQLHQDPPPEAVAALDRDHGTTVAPFGPYSSTFLVWSERLRYTDPHPAQIASIDRGGAIRILRVILGGKFFRRGYELRERTSRWIWALLARLPNRGELDCTQISWIREMGKRAVLIMVSIAEMSALREEVEDDLEGELVEDDGDHHDDDEEVTAPKAGVNEEEDGAQRGDPTSREPDAQFNGEETGQEPDIGTDGAPPPPEVDEDGEMDMDLEDGEVSDAPATSKDMDADIEAVKARLLARLEQSETPEEPAPESRGEAPAAAGSDGGQLFDQTRARVNMRATLTMILTVAGEFYGQRDLLEFRDPFAGL